MATMRLISPYGLKITMCLCLSVSDSERERGGQSPAVSARPAGVGLPFVLLGAPKLLLELTTKMVSALAVVLDAGNSIGAPQRGLFEVSVRMNEAGGYWRSASGKSYAFLRIATAMQKC